MKKKGRLLWVAAFCLLLIISCDRKEYIPSVLSCKASPASDTVVLDFNKPVPVFASCQVNLHATVTKIMDSRCPKDAVCVWAGKVSVVLQMDSLSNFTLEQHKVVDTIWNNHRFSFELVDVTPYPLAHSATTAAEQKAVITIIRR